MSTLRLAQIDFDAARALYSNSRYLWQRIVFQLQWNDVFKRIRGSYWTITSYGPVKALLEIRRRHFYVLRDQFPLLNLYDRSTYYAKSTFKCFFDSCGIYTKWFAARDEIVPTTAFDWAVTVRSTCRLQLVTAAWQNSSSCVRGINGLWRIKTRSAYHKHHAKDMQQTAKQL